MNKLLLLFLFLSLYTMAQYEPEKPIEYTYVTDRQFLDQNDLFGFTFVPSKGKLSNALFEDPIKLGLVQFRFTTQGLFITERVTYTTTGIKGENEKKTYNMSISQITNEGGCYYVTLIDLNNADIQGYFKTCPQKGFITKVHFKPEPTATERIYFIANTPDHILERDNNYFTHERYHSIESQNDFIGKAIFPYGQLKVAGDYSEFSRIYPNNMLYYKFEERTEVVGKKKIEKKYIVHNDARDQDYPQRQMLVKGIRFVEIMNYEGIKRNAYEFKVYDETVRKEDKIYVLVNGQKKVIGVLHANREYVMRFGERKFSDK